MIFPSYIFLLVFLPVVLCFWYGFNALKVRLIALICASYVFYGWWDYRFTVLMLGSTVLDYFCGKNIYNASSRGIKRCWLFLSIGGNLMILGLFKYYDFFAISLSSGLSYLGVTFSPPLLHVVLPLGISFYTFQSMSYSIDIFQQKCRPSDDFLRFSAYISMFPQLVAGPIVRYRSIEKQLSSLSKHKQVDCNQIADGVWLFLIGLVKKIWIADRLAPVAEVFFDSGQVFQFYGAWAGAVFYTLQLYFDFSAYSDMARGLGKILGFNFPINFNSPYKSSSILEFWRRWHITLSEWLRDHLYFSLGGSKKSLTITVRNLVVTMFLGGLWHGAAFTYIIWGLYHGVLLVFNALFLRWGRIQIPRVPSILLTFIVVVLGWVLFRAHSLEQAFLFYKSMLGINGFETVSWMGKIFLLSDGKIFLFNYSTLFVGSAALLLVFTAPNSDELPKPKNVVSAFFLAVIFILTLTQLMKATPFLYFQF